MFYRMNKQYDHPDVLFELMTLEHDLRNNSAVYADHLLFNIDFACPAIYKISNFVYFIRDPKQTLGLIIKNHNFNIEKAYSYYIFRIRRIYEMYRDSGGVFFTWDDLFNNRDQIKSDLEDYLQFDINLNLNLEYEDNSSVIPRDVLKKSEKIYEKYFFHMREINEKRNKK